MATTTSSLPLGTRLGEFELTGIVGEGGFSVVYVAVDHSLERTVAIKEYIPYSIATRQADGLVLPRSAKHKDTFQIGLASFINEARLLARFSHPALIHIHRVWEQNGTAYMAMQYCLGKTLRQISQTEPDLVRNEGCLKTTFTPILDALAFLHANNCFHRDLSPDNIIILKNGTPILLDFGAARQVIGDRTQALTVILRPGFAPIEQYVDDTSLQQGAWTDVYGISAVLYFLLIGKPPVASVARVLKDPLVKLTDVGDLDWISHSFRDAIDRALAVQPSQRIRSIEELSDALQLPTFRPDSLFGRRLSTQPAGLSKTFSNDTHFPKTVPLTPVSDLPTPVNITPDDQNPPRQNIPLLSTIAENHHQQQEKKPSTKPPWRLLAGVFGIVVFIVALGFVISNHIGKPRRALPPAPTPSTPLPTPSEPASVSESSHPDDIAEPAPPPSPPELPPQPPSEPITVIQPPREPLIY
ncbi:MAG: serine/threonine protein kinase [Pseudomonadales bacterium]|nr:serine/threonine protein kinase [Pseudomonadales bacterium]